MTKPPKPPKELTPAQKAFYATQNAVDCADVTKRLREIAEAAEELTPFEAEFIKDFLRMAAKFKAELRMSPKQRDTMHEMWNRIVLPKVIDAKVKKPATPAPAADAP